MIIVMGLLVILMFLLCYYCWKVLGVGVVVNVSFLVVFLGILMMVVFICLVYYFGNVELGVMLGVLGLGIVISELLWGLLIDCWGDCMVLLMGFGLIVLVLFVMVCCVVLLYGNVLLFVWLVGGMLSVGLLGGSVNGLSGCVVMGWFCEGECGLVMSICQIVVLLGGGVGVLVLLSLVVYVGFVVVYGVLVVVCVLIVVFMWLWVYDVLVMVNGVV